MEVSSLSAHGHGWAREECRRIRLTKRGKRVRVRLDGPPSYGLVRVVVRGTGTTPLYGASPRAPFAGLLGGAPGGADEGHDAVLTSYFPHLDSSQEKST